MRKPTSTAAPVRNAPAADEPTPKAKPTDGRINTTLRISPQGLEALKNVAAAKRIRVNDLLLEGAEHVLALNGRKIRLRK